MLYRIEHNLCTLDRSRLLQFLVVSACDVVRGRREMENAIGVGDSLVANSTVPDIAADEFDAVPPRAWNS